MLVGHPQVQHIPHLILEVAQGKAPGKPARIRAKDDAARADCLVELTVEILHRHVAGDPADPLQAATGVHAHIRAGPAELQGFPLPGTAKVGNHKSHVREGFGDVVQLERTDILVGGNATCAALNTKVDEYGDVQLGALLPHGPDGFVLNRLLDHRSQQFVAPQTQHPHRVVQLFHCVGQEGAVVGKADELVGIPATDFGQMLVAPAGDKTDGAHAVGLQILRPAPGLLLVAGMGFLRLRFGEVPHAPPLLAVGLAHLPHQPSPLLAHFGHIALNRRAHLGKPGQICGEMGVKVDYFKSLIHSKHLLVDWFLIL